mmetsp:Transcript_10930/g.16894  ORF Transcript_10930/g.16894 Transcript_10930/m.16894 type:complete len:251 (-) Transcript_10930:275-1027(-)|eukprot:CAMPEP_0195293956 /NCGR_PEP_ID=MMETSP0707-20130614/13834_1 /TAXON_ID=33640 /ORGANISM="Asterionellopsis glacialis, Strain CCMP134" /LENGTH=250 /DNA_ID=CAMNT_0040354795 /DNA_START=223 /DNA_END=975 /DNA_ORIENTATION=+
MAASTMSQKNTKKTKRPFWKRLFSKKDSPSDGKQKKTQTSMNSRSAAAPEQPPYTPRTMELDLEDMEDKENMMFTPPQLNGVMSSADYQGSNQSVRSRFVSDASHSMMGGHTTDNDGFTLGDTASYGGYTTEQSNWNVLGYGYQDDESTLDASFFDREVGGDSEVQHEQLEVMAPPGKLGLLMDTPETGFPFVYGIKDWSPLHGHLKEGDIVVRLDDEDVRFCTAIELSKRLSQKSHKKTRKLTILRPME